MPVGAIVIENFKMEAENVIVIGIESQPLCQIKLDIGRASCSPEKV